VAIASIKATKRIIEINSNGRKKSVDKPLLTKSCSIIWFALVVQIIPYHVVFEIIVISKTKKTCTN
jgi:hypothetical protein